jgi:hypothetical protein
VRIKIENNYLYLDGCMEMPIGEITEPKNLKVAWWNE